MAGPKRKKVSRGEMPAKEAPLPPKKLPQRIPPPEPAEESMKEVSEIRWLKRLVLVFVGFLALVILAAAAFIYFYLKGTSADVKIEIEGPEAVFRGVPFAVAVNVTNDSDRLLSQAEITVNLPENIKVLAGQNSGRLSDSVGDMGSGSLTKRTYQFLAVGEVGTEDKISFNFSYLSGGRNRFDTSQKFKVKTEAVPIELAVKKPDEVRPGSSFEVELTYKNVSGFDFPEMVLEIQYPSSFRFTAASLTPDSLNNYWRLGEVKAGSEGKLTVRGALQPVSGASPTMTVAFAAVFFGENYPVAETDVDLSLAPPPLETKILINQREDYVPRVGDRLNYAIQYRNLSGIALVEVTVEMELVGEMFDFNSVTAGGSWNPATRKITWNGNTNPGLRLLDAGGSGELGFSVNLKNSFPIARLGDKNFILKATVQISSPSVLSYLTAAETRVISSLETKVAGLITVDAQAFYRDAESGILNSGSMPPKVNQPTQYSLHWLIRNYGTDVKDVNLRASLPAGVRWTNVVKSNIESVPLYNEETREVEWSIDKIRATKGVLDSPVEAVFQIEATPDAASLGRFQPLFGDTSLRATDEFTGLELTSSDIAINSSLPDDMTIGQNGGKVGL